VKTVVDVHCPDFPLRTLFLHCDFRFCTIPEEVTEMLSVKLPNAKGEHERGASAAIRRVLRFAGPISD